MKTAVVFLSWAAITLAQQYTISTFAGGAPPPTPIAAVKAAFGPNPGIVADAGDLYFIAKNCVFKIDANGILTRVAGNGRIGASGDDGPALSAEFNTPEALAVDHSGNIYVTDWNPAPPYEARLRKISTDGTIRTVATGLGCCGGAGGLAVDRGDNLYMIDHNRIRKFAPDGNLTTAAGNGVASFSGDGGPATDAGLGILHSVAIDASGNLYIAASLYYSNGDVEQYYGGSIRIVTPDGIINTFAGTGVDGYSGDGGPATKAQIGSWLPRIAADRLGDLFIVDAFNHAIRRVTPDGTITSVNTQDQTGCYLKGSGPYICAGDMAIDESGAIYIVGQYSGLIQALGADGTLTTVEGGGPGDIGDGRAATNALVVGPLGVAVDANRNVYFADVRNNRIRKVAPDGTITTVAGNGQPRLNDADIGDGKAALEVPLACAPTFTCKGVVADSSGNLYFGDGDRLRKVSSDGVITTVAMATAHGLATDGKNIYIADPRAVKILVLAPDGTLSEVAGKGALRIPPDISQVPVDVAVDGAGNIYVAEVGLVRKVAPDGTISTIAGGGALGSAADGGPATAAALTFDLGIAADRSGNVFIAEFDVNRIRKVSTDGIISTIVGSCGQPQSQCVGYTGDDGPATNALMGNPARLAVDLDGNVYVSDYGNNAIRVLRPIH
jgi:sugar lactone lactonase YvrE